MAASAVAVALPTAAHAQYLAPVAVQVQKDEKCERSLSILEQIKLLPGRPELAKTLCTVVTGQEPAEAPTEQPPVEPAASEVPPTASEGEALLQMPEDYTPPAAGKPTEANTKTHDVAEHQEQLLGLPAEWPAGLTVWIPTLHNGEWHSYSNSNDTAEAGKTDAGEPVS
ncbi:hypothetical protein BJF79_05695 [Actinomadura sp. CNU-125]|nr:hypothetical protein BJF79_05695 [Actinomadura sp. CNU-125]